MDDYAQYEKDAEIERATNAKLLKGFADSLEADGLKESTIHGHVENVDFYINEFLLYSDIIKAKDGADHINEFLGYWFIKKAMWASAGHIKGSAASLKKFYKYMLEAKLISAEEFNDLKSTIKEEMSEWISTVKRYDDPSIENMEDVWGF